MDHKQALYRRFARYVSVDTQSDPDSRTFPSSAKQLKLGAILVRELRAAGVRKAAMDRHGYVTGEIPATVKGRVPVIGFLAHMDTSPEACGKGVRPRLHRNYRGGKIVINKKLGVELTPKNCPELSACRGEDIITASGDTLLGADDKAGLAIIVTAAEHLVRHPEIRHGKIKIAFTPDEEVGRGVERFDVRKFGAKAAYTVDGDTAGSIEDETFNADGVSIRVRGKSVHPGTAKGAMANAVRIVADIVSSWPENRLPETTEKREGFVMFTDLKGSVEEAEITGIAREHDLGRLKGMERHLSSIVAEKRVKYPLADIRLEFREQYRNMGPVLARRPEVMDNLIAAVKKAGLTPRLKPVRGGTDGARLSYMGLPTPNVFTGGYNYHGRYEWVSLDGMQKAVSVLVNLAREWAK